MTTKDAKHAVKLQEWGRMVTLCQESGLTVNQWCRENGLKPACYYYRLAQVRKAMLNHGDTASPRSWLRNANPGQSRRFLYGAAANFCSEISQ